MFLYQKKIFTNIVFMCLMLQMPLFAVSFAEYSKKLKNPKDKKALIICSAAVIVTGLYYVACKSPKTTKSSEYNHVWLISFQDKDCFNQCVERMRAFREQSVEKQFYASDTTKKTLEIHSDDANFDKKFKQFYEKACKKKVDIVKLK